MRTSRGGGSGAARVRRVGLQLDLCRDCRADIRATVGRWTQDYDPLPPSRINKHAGYTDAFEQVWPAEMVRFWLMRRFPKFVKARGRLEVGLIDYWQSKADGNKELWRETRQQIQQAMDELPRPTRIAAAERLLEAGHPEVAAKVAAKVLFLAAEEQRQQ